MGQVSCYGPRKAVPVGATVKINTTSRSKDEWSRLLSPFFLGPVTLGGVTSQNVENAWQFSKVYAEHVGEDGNPNELWKTWSATGWSQKFASRYPHGKGSKPEYSWWNGERLNYVQARQQIYYPLYSQAVAKTDAFQRLKDLYDAGESLALFDFDGYDFKAEGMSYEEILHDLGRPMGHSLVLAAMLEQFDIGQVKLR